MYVQKKLTRNRCKYYFCTQFCIQKCTLKQSVFTDAHNRLLSLALLFESSHASYYYNILYCYSVMRLFVALLLLCCCCCKYTDIVLPQYNQPT